MAEAALKQAYAPAVKQERTKEGNSQWSSRCRRRPLADSEYSGVSNDSARVQAIVDRQHGFFSHVPSAMRPLVLREIAEILELHESIDFARDSNKYMSTHSASSN